MSRRVAIVIAAAFLLTACDYVRDRPEPVARLPAGESSAVLDGNQIYQRDCAWCHGADGGGTVRGPDLDGELDGAAYTDFMLTTGRMPILTPDEETDRGPVAYEPHEIAAIVDHVASFGGTGPDIPIVLPDEDDVATGEALYAENCAACHSTTGVGGALTSGQIAPSLLASSPVEIAEAMLVGPGCPNDDPDCGPGDGAMPIFAEFSSDEVDAIAAYIDFLQTEGDRGGLGLGRIGPVTEGAVALVIGLGVLLAFVRWIGTSVRHE